MNLITATDFQSQLLEVANKMNHLIVSGPQGIGKRIGLLLHALQQFSNEEEGILVVLVYAR